MEMSDKYLIDLLPETPAHQFDFGGDYTDIDGNVIPLVIFDTAYFIMNVTMLYAMRRIMVDTENAKTFFNSVFSSWATSRLPYYLKQAYAYTLKYNPLNDVDITETLSDDITQHVKGSTLTDIYGQTDTKTYGVVTDTHTPYQDHTNTDSTKGFNSSNWSEANKSVETWTGTEQDQRTHTGDDTIVKTGTIGHAHTGTDTDTRNYTKTKSGSQAKTAPELLQKEYDSLFQDLARRALAEFIDRYTFYCEEVF